MASTIGRGLLAGAVGTALLNAVTYMDMALTDRGATSVPAETASRAVKALGGSAPQGSNRREAFGALAGIGTGLGVGVLASVARRAGLRLPAPLGAGAAGALALAATDVPVATLGVSDPRTWTAADWAREVLPHLAYGVGVRWTLDRTERPGSAASTDRPAAESGDDSSSTLGTVSTLASAAAAATAGPSAARSLVKSLVMGFAAGGRSSLGLAAPLLTSDRTPARLSGVGMVAGELVIDKLPATPSRLGTQMLGGRALAGAVGGAFVAGRHGSPALGPVGAVLGVVGAVTGSVLGAAWREIAQQQGYTWPAALVEDGVAVGLAAYALR